MKIILDLCGGTGAWSKPYKEAGYDVWNVTLPYADVRKISVPDNVYGILVAPPCTMFSLARTTAKKPRDLDEGMELVRACMEVVWEAKINGGSKILEETAKDFENMSANELPEFDDKPCSNKEFVKRMKHKN